MATTRYTFTPEAAGFPSTNFPQLLLTTRHESALAFDAATSEASFWKFTAPQGLTLPLTAIVSYAMVSATSGAIVLRGYIEAVTSGDALNILTTDSFDSANSVTDTVPASAGNLQQVTITLTNNDSIAAADACRFKLDRDAANGSDTATGDLYITQIELRDSA